MSRIQELADKFGIDPKLIENATLPVQAQGGSVVGEPTANDNTSNESVTGTSGTTIPPAVGDPLANPNYNTGSENSPIPLATGDPLAGGKSIDQVFTSSKTSSTGSKFADANTVLDEDDIKKMSYEEIYNLSLNSSNVNDETRTKLARALRGATQTGGFGEFLVGTIGETEFERIVEEKYQDYIKRNPDAKTGLLQQAISATSVGSSAPQPVGVDERPEVSGVRAFTDTAANSASGGFNDEILSVLGAKDSAQAIRDSRDQLYDDSFALGLGADILGSVIPAGAALKAAGVTNVASASTGQLARAGALEGAVTGFGTAEGGVVDRADDAILGSAIGAVAPSALGFMGNRINSVAQKFRRAGELSAADTNSVRTFLQSISLETGKTPEEVASALSKGKSLVQYLESEGIEERTIERITNGLGTLSEDAYKMLNDAATRRSFRVADTARAKAIDGLDVADRERLVAGRIVGQARDTLTPEKTEAALRQIMSSEKSNQFKTSIARSAKTILNFNDEAMRRAGYTKGDSAKIVTVLDPKDPQFGIYIPVKEGSKKRFKGAVNLTSRSGDKKYIKMQIDNNVFDEILTDLDTSASGLLRENGPAVKTSTSVGEKYAEAATEVRNAIKKHVPELDQANDTFAKIANNKNLLETVRSAMKPNSSSVTSIRAIRSAIDDYNAIPSIRSNPDAQIGDFEKNRIMEMVINERLGDVSTNNLLQRGGKRFESNVVAVMKESGLNDTQISNYESLFREMQILEKTNSDKISGVADSFIQNVARGAIGRWYLGMPKALAASLVWNVALKTSKGIRKSVKKMSDENLQKLINATVDMPDEEFVRMMQTVVERDNSEWLAYMAKNFGHYAVSGYTGSGPSQ